MTTVTWVKNANGFYEVSSAEHLVQMMHKGTRYTDTGDAPTTYSSSSTKFLQTADIDLASYHAEITPIAGNWTSLYDGGNHEIANWEFLADVTGNYTGFFTTLRGVFKNVRLTGVWKIGGDKTYKGFIAGAMNGSMARIDNVTAVFEKGTEMSGTTTHAGAFVGFQQNGSGISGCTLRGVVDFSGTFTQLGGFVGSTSQPISMTYCANFATFPNGIIPKANGYCGGMIGNVGSGVLAFHNLVNGMIGDIGNDTVTNAGGITGQYITHTTPPTRVDTFVVAMQGNLTCKSSGFGVGGIIGYTYGSNPIEITKAVNYMSGNIVGGNAGGLVGRFRNLSASVISVTNSIVAMNGNVEDDAAVTQIDDATNADVRVMINTDFGLTFSTNNYASTDALVDFVTDDVFTLLPYVPISGTSEEGSAVALDPVFGNLGGIVDGASPYRAYSTLTIHTSPEVFYPVYVDMGFSDTNTSKYLTYGQVTSHKVTIHVDDAISGPFTTAADTVSNVSGTILKGLEWTQNGASEYEVATAAHLIQLMTNGAVYDDFGTSPRYMTDSFTQTSDVSLAGKESVTAPIGDAAAPFTGVYSGSSHAISNWAYDRGSPDDGTGVGVGLFGTVDGGTVRGLKMTGVWSMSGSCDAHGLLVGKLMGAAGSISDIDSNFDAGSSITSGHATSSRCGLLVGSVEGACTVTGVRVGGHLSYDGSDSVLGGAIGSVSDGASIRWVDSHVTLTDGLGGANTISTATVGGIIGTIGPNAADAFHLSNNSNGSIAGGTCGGIVGSISTGAMTRADTWANGMTGDIVGSICAGGVVGEFEALSANLTALSKVTNYMSGDVTSASSGGIIGRTVDSSSGAAPAIECTNSVVALHGTVADTAVGYEGHPVSMAIRVNADFGLVYTTNTHETADPLTGYETVTGFPLPFLPTTGTESGLTHDREAVFPNVRGVADSSPLFGYEVAVVHSCPEIYVPYRITFDFVSDGTTKYVTYANVTKSEAYVFPQLSVTSSSALYTMDYDENAKFGMLQPIAQTETKYGTVTHIHSFTGYTDEYVIGTHSASVTGAFDPVNLWAIGGHVVDGFTLNWVRPRGLHYNADEQNVYFVSNDNRQIAKAKIDGSSGIVYVAADATYNTLAGDSSNTYMFGSRLAGGVNQVYRIDSDGTNMMTADVSVLIGSNVEVNGFTSNRDDERIYFSDTNSVVYSLSWALDDIQTMPFQLRSTDHASIYYHQGSIYFGGKHPITGQEDSQIYVYDLTRGGFRNLEGINRNINTQSQGFIGRNNFFVHPGTNRLLIVSQSGLGTHVGTDFDFHKSYIAKGTQYSDGYDLSWLPVEGATSYKVDINGVAATLAGTTYTTRGHADGDHLSVKLSYSTDGTTYSTYRYGYTTLMVEAQFSVTYIPGGLPVVNTGSATWADPYDNPHVALLCGSGNMYTYDVVARTVQSVNARNMHRLDRSPTTKDIVAVGNNGTSLFNAGVNAVRIGDNTLPSAFYTHTSGIKHIHCSYSGLVYFVDVNNEVWSVELDGTEPKMIVSTSDCKVAATDVYDPDKLVYSDGAKLMYLNLSTNTTTEIFSERNTYTDLFVTNDLAYFSYNNHRQSLRVRLDGTVENDGSRATYYGYSMLVAPTQQKVYLFGRTEVVEVVDGTYTMPSFPPNPSSMIVTTNPLGLLATWGPISEALEYRVGTSVGVEGENAITIRHTTVDDLVYRHPAEAESTHTVYLYYDTSAASNILHSSRTVTLPPISNSVEDFDKDFFVSSGNSDEYDLTAVKGDLGVVLNDLFQTGDRVSMKLPNGKEVKTQFVRRGETIRVTNDAPISVPFSRDAGAGQKVSLTLSDDSTVDVEFDETTEAITINGVEYRVGDTLIMDGQKVTVVDA